MKSAFDDEGAGAMAHPPAIPWYVAGLLDADEAREVEEHVKVCPQCEAEVRAMSSMRRTLLKIAREPHVPAEALVALAEGRDPVAAVRPGGIRRHLQECLSCREDLEMVRASVEDPEEGAVERPGPAARPGGGRRRIYRRAGLAAAALVLVAATAAMTAVIVGPPGAEEITALTLVPSQRGGTSLPALHGVGPWVLTVALPSTAPDGRYRIGLRRQDGSWELPGGLTARAGEDQTVRLLLRRLDGPGAYRLSARPLATPEGSPFAYSFRLAPGGGSDR